MLFREKKTNNVPNHISKDFFELYGQLTTNSFSLLIDYYCKDYPITPEQLLERCKKIKEIDPDTSRDVRLHIQFVSTLASYGADEERTIKQFKKVYINKQN